MDLNDISTTNLTLQPITRPETSVLSELFGLIALQYLYSSYCFCFITNGKSDYRFTGIEFDRPFISIDLESVTVSVQTMNLELGCQVYILSEKASIGFLDIYRHLQDHTNQRFPNKAFIVAMGDNATYDELQSILDRPIVFDIPKLLILSPSGGSGAVDLWTNQFSGAGGHRKLLYLDTYSFADGSFQYDADLFPDKIADLEGRFIRLAMLDYEPYTTWTEVDDRSKANAYVGDEKKLLVDGTETRLFLEFCRIHNCSLDMSREDEAEWGEVYENFTGVGIMGAVAEHRVDAGYAAMLAWYYDSNTPSQPVSRTGVTCITPKQKLLPSWLTPILPFSNVIWRILFATVLATSIVLLIFNYVTVRVILQSRDYVDICEVFLSVWSTLVLCSSILRIEQYKLTSQLTIVTILLFSGLIIGNTYCGGLSSIMTVPQYEKPIDTTAQLVVRKMIWGASHDAWVYSLEDTDEPLVIKLVSYFRSYPKATLHDRAKNPDMAYAIERLTYGHYGISDYIAMDVAQNFQVMIEDLYWGHCVIQMKKTWPMVEHLNVLIMRVFQSGIQRYWEETVMAQFPAAYTVQKIIALARVHDNPGAIALQVHHLTGPFFMLLFGLTGALLIFMVEITWHNLANSKKIRKIK
ncbi:uncharacterized protein LOC109400810 [Aedes albopictus]|uniref:Ionotropic glutamate receptor C-terminal domain-containing protein n=1 Tax=Aedes albopictus TaxID=7160 RepID=A0ABM1ZJM8_AEDAL